jgi:bifunctional non-homologous end joining protein LigD
MADRLTTYRAKRDFSKTTEPSGKVGARKRTGFRYLIQKHDATRLHFDFRLELDGVLLSWAVTRGPSFDPKEKRLAVHVEDHPLDYGDFEGTIPKGNYGGGTVMLWDEGTWEPVGDPEEAMAKGDLKFILHGERLKGKWVLIRMRPRKGERSKHENWLLIKEADQYSGPEKKPIIERAMTSVRSGRTMEEIASGNVEWVEGVRFKEKAPAKREKTSGVGGEPPKFVPPQLATLDTEPPSGNEWIHEIKFDGYRAEAAVGGGKVRIYTRTGLDWTEKFQSILRPLADLPCRSALIDGEAVVHDKDGRSNFGLLQQAMAEGRGNISYYAFDLLFLDGKDLRKLPLVERKEHLAKLLADQPKSGPLYYSDHVVGHGQDMLAKARELNLEGIVSKRASAPYRSERTKGWLKIKVNMGQELIIIGWQPSTVKNRPFSSLLVATRDEDKLTYRGKVGTGYGERELKTVWKELERRPVNKSPADDVPSDVRRKSHFVKPDLVAEVEFAGWTGDGYVRHGAFKGLRLDKPAQAVVKEKPTAPPTGKGASRESEPAIVSINTDNRDTGAIEIAGVRVTHPKRPMFAGQKITKRQLIDYYLAVKDLILPHVAYRPLSLVRFPQGAGGDGFFQKHASAGFPREFKPITIKEKEGKGQYLYIEDERGLVASAQMGALELHIWGSHIKTLEKPDRVVFDFDPDEAVPFAVVRESAREMRERLRQIGLESFAMATGGKGIHVVVPLKPRYDWEDVRAFAEAIARTLAAEDPDRYLAEMSKARRKGRIFVDYLRNGRGATAICPFSTRARKGAPIAWPVSWNALAKLESAHETTLENFADTLRRQKADPWKGYFDVDQVLPLEKLARKR